MATGTDAIRIGAGQIEDISIPARPSLRISIMKRPSPCLGTMTFGQQNTEAEGYAQMDRAVSAGIDFLDTAEMYSIPSKAETQGSTERIVGNWLAARGGRDKFVLATKVSLPDASAASKDDGGRRSVWRRPGIGRRTLSIICATSAAGPILKHPC